MARTVLVVDDDPSVLEVIAAMLEDLGCDVVTAANGLDALDQLNRNQRIAILITDINMPGMDGHELAERAIKISPELQIIQLSGRERRRDGFPMIRKPFSEDDLANTMQRTTGLCWWAGGIVTAPRSSIEGTGVPRSKEDKGDHRRIFQQREFNPKWKKPPTEATF